MRGCHDATGPIHSRACERSLGRFDVHISACGTDEIASTVRVVRRIARRILETAIVGRPLRKFVWITIGLSKRIHHLSSSAFPRLPYVKKLSRQQVEYNRGAEQSLRDRALNRYYERLTDSIDRLHYRPKISVLIPVYKVRPEYLSECLGSVAAQLYSNWEVCIVDDASHDQKIDRMINAFTRRFPDRVKYVKHKKNLNISAATNSALKIATGEYVALLDHDDRLLPNALAEVVRFACLNPGTEIFYSDESKIDEQGRTIDVYLKPNWSPLMHLSVNYTTHLSIYRRDLLVQIGGCRRGFEGSQDHDLMLRAVDASTSPVVHIPLVLYEWRAHALSTAMQRGAKPDAARAGIEAVRAACERRGRPAEVYFESATHHYKVRFDISPPQPLVSIIIPTRDNFDLLQTCLESIFALSSYREFEVIVVDHASTDSRCLELFEYYELLYPSRFRRMVYRGTFNFAAQINLGARGSKGKYYLLLNDDTEVKTPAWIEELLSVAQLPEIGAVGAKLLYPDSTIQHAGIYGDGIAVAQHIGLGRGSRDSTYHNYLSTTHEVLAVTGACLMISSDAFHQVRGLDERYLANGYGDVDFCLKLRASGFTNVYVPYAVLEHRESATRGKNLELFERIYMHREWAEALVQDPYRHPTFADNQFTVEDQYRVQAPSAELFERLLRWKR